MKLIPINDKIVVKPKEKPNETKTKPAGVLNSPHSWAPWFNDIWPDMPAGYVTTYNVTGAPTKDFSFLTIRLAGHSECWLLSSLSESLKRLLCH